MSVGSSVEGEGLGGSAIGVDPSKELREALNEYVGEAYHQEGRYADGIEGLFSREDFIMYIAAAGDLDSITDEGTKWQVANDVAALLTDDEFKAFMDEVRDELRGDLE